MTINENWAVSYARAKNFFSSQEDVTITEEGFAFEDCQIKLIPSKGEAGPFFVERTILSIEGPEEQASIIYKRFFLNFLSAGG